MINYNPGRHQLRESGLHEEEEQNERHDLDLRAGYQEKPIRGQIRKV